MPTKRPDIERESVLLPVESGGDNSLQIVTLRLPRAFKNKLATYFRNEKGIDLSSGLREWIFERARRDGIR